MQFPYLTMSRGRKYTEPPEALIVIPETWAGLTREVRRLPVYFNKIPAYPFFVMTTGESKLR